MNITEKRIMHFYKNIDINHPQQLSVDTIAEKSEICIHYWEYSSEVIKWRGKVKLFLNDNLNERQKWQEFGHEMKHVFYDVGRQEFLPNTYVYFQECKADHFAYHFCIPTFMLLELRQFTVYNIMNLFNVEYDFALKRIEMYQNKIISKGDKICELQYM